MSGSLIAKSLINNRQFKLQFKVQQLIKFPKAPVPVKFFPGRATSLVVLSSRFGLSFGRFNIQFSNEPVQSACD